MPIFRRGNIKCVVKSFYYSMLQELEAWRRQNCVRCTICVGLEGFPSTKCRDAVNSHVRAKDFRDKYGTVRLLIILDNGDPGAADGES